MEGVSESEREKKREGERERVRVSQRKKRRIVRMTISRNKSVKEESSEKNRWITCPYWTHVRLGHTEDRTRVDLGRPVH